MTRSFAVLRTNAERYSQGLHAVALTKGKEERPDSMHSFGEKLKFLAEFIRAPRMVGSVVPTSPRVISSLLDRVDWPSTRLFVEYGPGVGTFTRPVLERLGSDDRLIAIDTSRRFIDHLAQTIHDPRLVLVHGSAADVEAIVARSAPGQQVDYVLSGLLYPPLHKQVGDAIVAATYRGMRRDCECRVSKESGLFLRVRQEN